MYSGYHLKLSHSVLNKTGSGVCTEGMGMGMGRECQQVGWDLAQVREHGGQLFGMMAQNPQSDLGGTSNNPIVLVPSLVD